MRYGITFLERLQEESKLHQEWTKRWSALMSCIIGVCISILFGISATPKYSWENLLLAISWGLLSGAFSYQGSIMFTSWLLFKRIKVEKTLDEMNMLQRMGDALGSLLFFIKSSHFEETLKWFSHDHTLEVKNIIAKVIFKQLNRSFEAKAIKLYINSYGEHSKIISEIMEDAKDICFTCIKAPYNWFKELDKDIIEHEPLPSHLGISTPFFDRDKLLSKGYSPERVDQYPTHFIKFLNNTNGGMRKRVFLLNNAEWADLISPDNYDHFKKFIVPCIGRIDTIFVNVVELEEKANIADQHTSQIVKDAIESNITTEDYDIFEKHALMVYKKVSESLHMLEFKVGGKTKEYSDFIEFLFNIKNEKYGIYSPQKIEEMIANKTATTN